jgi:hypothetical protein
MAGKRLSRSERLALALKSLEARLSPALAGAVKELAPGKPPSAFGLLRAWRRLGRVSGISPHDRNLIREGFVKAFTRLLHEASTTGTKPFTPGDFGVRGSRELAELFVTMLDRVGYAKASLSKLRRIRSLLVGELLEVLVRNSSELQPGLLGMAKNQLKVLWQYKKELVDAHGNPVVVPKSFEAPAKAIDMVITGNPPPRKFIDFAHVSLGEWPDGTRFIAFLVETEIKMPTAARKAGKQIGQAQVRFDMAKGDVLEANVAGKLLKFRADQIVFAPHSIDRTLVTISNMENFRPRRTSAGGYDEAFWQIDLEMKATSLRRLVDLAIP